MTKDRKAATSDTLGTEVSVSGASVAMHPTPTTSGSFIRNDATGALQRVEDIIPTDPEQGEPT